MKNKYKNMTLNKINKISDVSAILFFINHFLIFIISMCMAIAFNIGISIIILLVGYIINTLIYYIIYKYVDNYYCIKMAYLNDLLEKDLKKLEEEIK